MKTTSQTWLYNGNAPYLDGLYESYLKDRSSVPPCWQTYFDHLSQTESVVVSTISDQSDQQTKELSFKPSAVTAGPVSISGLPKDKQVAVLQLINSYRFLGHRQAELDPLKQYERPPVPELELEYHGLGSADMNSDFNTGSLRGVPDHATLREILNAVSTTYCGTIGSEYMHITDTAQKRWIQERLETAHGNPPFRADIKRRILEKLIAGQGLEEYLHKKYVGQKRFSLEGGISLIPLLYFLIERCGFHKIKEVLFGMAHRGRLNVLVNIFGKSTELLFQEFEGTIESSSGSGDVKYHKGFSSGLMTQYGTVHTVLAFNPSHLEIIDPVVEGSVRARQQRRGDLEHDQVLPVLIHGDAAFTGQGVVMETFNLSQTRGYKTGGTVHIIVNNQIGFTTSDPLDSRSTLYCTDVAKMVQAPIFHVNGDDPEAVAFISEIALDFRMKFKKDVVIDLVCYRRHGHSEADEPSVTQPIMSQCIRGHQSIRERYAQQLIDGEIVTAQQVKAMEEDYLDRVKRNYAVSGPLDLHYDTTFSVDYTRYLGAHWRAPADTRLTLDHIRDLTEKMTHIPAHVKIHPRVVKLLDERRKMAEGTVPTDWGYAETLAYASLLVEGHLVRLSGQDSVRGTFFHRHAAVHDQASGEVYIPLQHLFEGQPQFLPINSSLSEAAVLGFEVGYSTADPDALVIWEAQFGDFANNAQVIIDQFISSSEAKWQRLCGLVLFLPHGYDGQGPEHSSARLERYLQLCAEDNIQVCVPSTPAQMFHLLRRQVIRHYRKPLIVMSPKSLLRHKLSTSTLQDLSEGHFYPVIGEIDNIEARQVTRLLFCSGKVYYDLLAARREHRLDSIAIVRIEQQYPFPREEVGAAISRYPNAIDVVWVQEEPRNQGAWYYMQSRRNLKGVLTPEHRLEYAGRPYSASPAVGYLHMHREQQKALVAEALQLGMTKPHKKAAEAERMAVN
jgi:2-oxoglutarate dehydrogenase E1 component